MLMFLRSCLWSIYAALTVFVGAVLVIAFRPLPHRVSFAVCKAWCVGMLYAGRFFCGIRYVVEGKQNMPAEPSVILVKHSSLFEAYAQAAIFPRSVWVIKQELLSVPFFGWGVVALKAIAIDRRSSGAAVRQVIEHGKARLAEGIWVTIFPEGTRMPPGTTRRYGVSGAALARAAGCPIVPVAHNAADIWSTTGFPKKPGTIRICIGPPIDATAREPKETNLVVQDWIESKMREISEGYRSHDAAGDPLP